MSKITLKNNQGVEFTIESISSSVPKALSFNDITYTRANVNIIARNSVTMVYNGISWHQEI